MQAISQMLHGIGFAPALQSSYTQGEYPLALGFKPPPDVSAKRLPAPAIEFTPPTLYQGFQPLLLVGPRKIKLKSVQVRLQSMTGRRPAHLCTGWRD
jgi:hypothetical protein